MSALNLLPVYLPQKQDHHTSAAEALGPGQCVLLTALAGDPTLRTAAAVVRRLGGNVLIAVTRITAMDDFEALLPKAQQGKVARITSASVEERLLAFKSSDRPTAIRSLLTSRPTVCITLDMLHGLMQGMYHQPPMPHDALQRLVVSTFSTVIFPECEQWDAHAAECLAAIVVALHALKPTVRTLIAGSPLPAAIGAHLVAAGLPHTHRKAEYFVDGEQSRVVPLLGPAQLFPITLPLLKHIEARVDQVLAEVKDRPANTYAAIVTTSSADAHALYSLIAPQAAPFGLSVALSTRYERRRAATADLTIGTSLPERGEPLAVLFCEAYDGPTLVQRVSLAGRAVPKGGVPPLAHVTAAVPKVMVVRLGEGTRDVPPLIRDGEKVERWRWQEELAAELPGRLAPASWTHRWGCFAPIRSLGALSREDVADETRAVVSALRGRYEAMLGVSAAEVLTWVAFHAGHGRLSALFEAWSLRGRDPMPVIVLTPSGPIMADLTSLLPTADIELVDEHTVSTAVSPAQLAELRSLQRLRPMLYCRITQFLPTYVPLTVILPREVAAWQGNELSFVQAVKGVQIVRAGAGPVLLAINAALETRAVPLAYQRGIDPHQLRKTYGLPPIFPVFPSTERGSAQTKGSVVLGFTALIFDSVIGDMAEAKKAREAAKKAREAEEQGGGA